MKLDLIVKLQGVFSLLVLANNEQGNKIDLDGERFYW